MHTLLLRLAAGLGLLLAGGAAARPYPPDDPPPEDRPPAWAASLFYQYDALSDGRPAWQTWHAYARRGFGRGSLIVEGLRVRRFDAWDEVVALDAWRDLWRGAYANVRLQAATRTPRLLPRHDVYAELYQGLGAWEVAAHYRRRAYPAETIHAYGAGLGYYVGNWYLRGRLTLTPRLGQLGWSQTLMARRYWNAPLEFVEVLAGRGRAVEIIDVGPVLTLTQTAVVAVRLQRYVSPRLGFTVGAAYSDDDFFTRRSLTLGLLARW